MNALPELPTPVAVNARNIFQRLADAQGKVDYIQKEKKAGMQYTVVSHDAVTAKVRPVLVECGVHYYPHSIVFEQVGNRTQVLLKVRFTNVDKPEEFIDVDSLGYGIDPQDKGPGKAISYAVKYALLKCLGLETGDDPDLDQTAKFEPPVPKDDALTVEALKVFEAGLATVFSKQELDTYSADNKALLDAAATKAPQALEKAREAFKTRLKAIKIEAEAEAMMDNWRPRIVAADKATRAKILADEINPAREAGKLTDTQYEIATGWIAE